MAHDPNKLARLVAAINRLYKQDLILADKMPRGVNGAWTVVNQSTGVKQVLKLVSEGDATQQILGARDSAQIAQSPQAPTPKFGLMGFIDRLGTFYLQEHLPGLPAPWPTHKLVLQLIELNKRQESDKFTSGQNYADRVLATLHDDVQGWQERIAGFGKEGGSFLQRLRPLFPEHLVCRRTDVVHGDFQHYNALVTEDDVLTGYVDWDQAGHGDRAFDLARLLYDCYVAEAELRYPPRPETIAALKERIVTISGEVALRAYMAFWCLQVADFGVKIGRADALKFFKTGRRIISELD